MKIEKNCVYEGRIHITEGSLFNSPTCSLMHIDLLSLRTSCFEGKEKVTLLQANCLSIVVIVSIVVPYSLYNLHK